MSEATFDIASLEVADFETTRPYEHLWSLKDKAWDQDQAFKKMQARAKEIKFTGFLAAWRAYQKQNEPAGLVPSGQVTDFKGMPYTVLASGRWICTDDGIYTEIPGSGNIIACPHPILIAERFEDLETGSVKLRIAFKLGSIWRDVVIERSIVASSQKIIQLADLGIGVTSESAKYLVMYLAELEMLNYGSIPSKRSVSRLGWVGGADIFSPYEEGIEFDGQHAFRQAYEATKPAGSFKKWKECMLECLALDPTVRIAVAASFASPILKMIGALSNVVHLYATTSTGKTMILKMAISGWGDPEPGKLIKSFNATAYAIEQYAGFFNGVPAILDELQINREKFGGAKKVSLYQMTQGSSGGRGRRDGGLRTESQWRLSFITSGEEPIASTFDAAGAHARMIEIHLNRQIVNLEMGLAVSAVIDKNYGHAGPIYIDTVKAIGAEGLTIRNNEIVADLSARNIQPKQAMTGSSLLLAYEILNGCIFDGKAIPLTIEELLPHLLTDDDIDPTIIAYEQIVEWVAANSNRFQKYNDKVEHLGIIENGKAYIIRSQFNKFIESINMSPRSVLAGLANRGLIETSSDSGKTRFDVVKHINGALIRVVVTNLGDYEINDERRTY